MPIGDDERRRKSRRHREAAYHRWQSRGERATRRMSERVLDGIDWLLRGTWWIVTAPFRAGSRLRSGRDRRSYGRSGRSWRR